MRCRARIAAHTPPAAAPAADGVASYLPERPARAKATGGKDGGGKAPRPGTALPGNSKAVTFGGYAISVPAGWPVYSLAADPSRCVRFDRHAVYLGRPGANQQCPPVHPAGTTAATPVPPAGGRPPSG